MIIVTDRLIPKRFDALTVWPFIFVRPAFARDEALLSHELVHYEEQRAAWVVPWLLSYWLSDNFRFNAELRAYAVQVKAGRLTVDEATTWLLMYDTGATPASIRDALNEETARWMG